MAINNVHTKIKEGLAVNDRVWLVWQREVTSKEIRLENAAQSSSTASALHMGFHTAHNPAQAEKERSSAWRTPVYTDHGPLGHVRRVGNL